MQLEVKATRPRPKMARRAMELPRLSRLSETQTIS